MGLEHNQVRGALLASDETRSTNKLKTKFCMYHLQGVCQYGAKCAFAHSIDELQREAPCTSPTGSTLSAASQSDEEVRPVDMSYKTTPCMWYERGGCRKGEQCRFAHGADDIRKSGGRQPKALTEKFETQRRYEAIKGNRHTPGGFMVEGRIVTTSGESKAHSRKGPPPPGLDHDLIKGSVRSMNRSEPMFVQPMASTVAPALSALPRPRFVPPPPGLEQHMPAPCFSHDDLFPNMMYTGQAFNRTPISLAEGLEGGLAGAPVEDFRRESQIMMLEQQQIALEAEVQGHVQSLIMKTAALVRLQSGEAQLSGDEAQYMCMMDANSQLIGA